MLLLRLLLFLLLLLLLLLSTGAALSEKTVTKTVRFAGREFQYVS